MRWFAPFVIVALVVAGASRPAQATRLGDRSSITTAASNVTKLAPRRALVARGAVTDRRYDTDEVFVTPRIEALSEHAVVSWITSPSLAVSSTTPAAIEQVARGPPSLVVLFHPPF